MEDLISVIVPVYNTGNLLLTCVESILQSTYKNLELIIVDDGSNTKTAELCEVIQTTDQRILLFHIENRGVSFARNYGIEKSQGKYIVFVDADDTISSNAIETLYRLCTEYSVDFSMCGYIECYADGRKNKVLGSNEIKVWNRDNLCQEFFGGNNIGWNVWAKMYKRSLLETIRFPVGMRIAEDMYFIYQVCMSAEKAVKKSVPLYKYMKQDNSAMAATNCEKFFDNYILLKRVLDDGKFSLSEETTLEKRQFYIRHTLRFLRFIIVRDCKNTYDHQIKEICDEVVKCVNTHECGKMKFQQQMELTLLRYAYPIFKIYAYLLRIR